MPQRTRRTDQSRRLPRALLKGTDYGAPIVVRREDVGATGDGWIEPFLQSNRPVLARLALEIAVRPGRDQTVELKPGAKIGAVALISPTTQRPVAGLLVEPRFKWGSLGAVYRRIGFAVPPTVGGGLLVPGSARHVPPWLLAAPVLGRIEVLLAQHKRAFIEVSEEREAPRGRVDWGHYIRRNFVSGRWTRFDCTYPQPALDPNLAANIRWTTERLRVELNQGHDVEVARSLMGRIDAVDGAVGDGPRLRPEQRPGRETTTVFEALEAMGWVADERGLGGARALDGLSWDVAIAEVWEEWVRRFVADLAPRLGLRTGGANARAVQLTWHGATGSMQKLKPDAAMLGQRRTVWFDAKYKPHLAALQRRGWFGASAAMQSEHRADLHQALAYSACGSTEEIDAVLVYPSLVNDPQALGLSHAEVGRGARRSRVVLGALPFGFLGPGQREQALREWQEALRAG